MSSNPMLKQNIAENVILEGKPMSISGAINKTAILLGIVVLVAYYAWTLCAGGFSDKANMFLIGGSVIGLILAIITSFNPKASPVTAPAYAVCEGFVVGVVSYAYGAMFEGIVFNALGITILALFAMLFMYKTKVLQATPTFRRTIIVATFAVMIFYLAGFIGALLGHPMTVFNGGATGIVISVVICAIAAFNFILDFDFIEQGERNNLPDYFEWYGGFALLVTLVWLYLEILRLLAQLSKRD